MFKVNVSIKMGIMSIIVISRNLPEPKVFSKANAICQMKCAAYRCQGRVSLTQRFIVQRSHPWLLHPPQQLRSGPLGSALIKGI